LTALLEADTIRRIGNRTNKEIVMLEAFVVSGMVTLFIIFTLDILKSINAESEYDKESVQVPWYDSQRDGMKGSEKVRVLKRFFFRNLHSGGISSSDDAIAGCLRSIEQNIYGPPENEDAHYAEQQAITEGDPSLFVPYRDWILLLKESGKYDYFKSTPPIFIRNKDVMREAANLLDQDNPQTASELRELLEEVEELAKEVAQLRNLAGKR
jgi:hypothetical protein